MSICDSFKINHKTIALSYTVTSKKERNTAMKDDYDDIERLQQNINPPGDTQQG